MLRGYNVYKNDQFAFFIEGRSKASRKAALSQISIGTHMGEWQRTLTLQPENLEKSIFEYEYHTTVGVYIRFVPALQGV